MKNKKSTIIILLSVFALIILAFVLFLFFGEGEVASDFTQVNKLTRSQDFVDSFLGKRNIEDDIEGNVGSAINQITSYLLGTGVTASFDGKLFITKQKDEILLYNNKYDIVGRKSISQFFPNTDNWKCGMLVEHSDKNIAWFRLRKQMPDGEYWSHGILKVTVGENGFSIRGYDVGKYSCFAVDGDNNRVFVFRCYEQYSLDIYDIDLKLHDSYPLANTSSPYWASYNKLSGLIALRTWSEDTAKVRTVLFDPEKRAIVDSVKGHADGWTDQGHLLLRSDRRLCSYDPESRIYRMIYKCPITSRDELLIMGSDPSLLCFEYTDNNLFVLKFYRVFIDLETKECLTIIKGRLAKSAN